MSVTLIKELEILISAHDTEASTNLCLVDCLAKYYRFNPNASQGGDYSKNVGEKYIKREDWKARCPVIEKGRSFEPYLEIDPKFAQEDNDNTTIPQLQSTFFGIALHHAGNTGYKTPLEVQNLHIDEKDRADIGYHFAIGLDGKVYEGRPIGVKGSHLSKYNTGVIGIVFLGDFDHQWYEPDDNMTRDAIRSAMLLIIALKEQFTNIVALGGHKEWKHNSARFCPGDHGMEYVKGLRNVLKDNTTNLPIFLSPKEAGHGEEEKPLTSAQKRQYDNAIHPLPPGPKW
ncbi:hypothetical protein A8C32_03735 [Flavivirga aquatica]|uniref:Peptidoglycan recognition protein family domain-containing protein n=1 Tax=Flavivirga aquatica TaxID=1849968 RepID=A0A1E5TB13_9FLAO|nr:N-acetylmuramoyl-L-alanine amidase [Flavivirga aquatica]OEK08572.1 hypothetical protein A8C32_03735 [Flavivirga aquatica]